MKIHLLGGMLVLLAILSGCSDAKSESEVSFIERPSTSMPAISTESESINDLKNDEQSGIPDYVKPGQWSFDLTEPESSSVPEESSQESLESSGQEIDNSTAQDNSINQANDSSISQGEPSSQEDGVSSSTEAVSFDGFTYNHLLRNGGDYFSFPAHEDVILESTDTEFRYNIAGSLNGVLVFRDPTTFADGVTQRLLLEQESRDLIYQWDKSSGDPTSLGVTTLSGGTEVEVFYAVAEDCVTVSFTFVQRCNDVNWLCGNLSSRGTAKEDFDVLLNTVKYMGYPEVFDSVNSVLTEVFPE